VNDILRNYESVALSSAQMLAAARRQDWDALVAAERRCAGVIAQIRASGGEDALGADARQRKSEIILQVLEHDAEIRRLVDPRLRELESMLGSSATQRRIDRAYGR